MKKFAIFLPVITLLMAGCSSPPAVHRLDPETDRYAAAAKSAYAAGLIPSAEMFYQKALNHARLTDQPAEITRLAYNLAACRAQTQKYNEALAALDEAQMESTAAGLDFPEIKLLRAEIVRHQGQTNKALAIATAGINELKNRKDDPRLVQFQIFLAELACDQNDGKRALDELDQIDRHLLAASGGAIQAKTTGVRGQALLIEKRPAEAAVCFDQAAVLYQRAQQYREMAVMLNNAAGAYEAANQLPEACNRYYRAARSMLFCGEKIKAEETIAKANRLAKAANDRQMADMLARLKTEAELDSGAKK